MTGRRLKEWHIYTLAFLALLVLVLSFMASVPLIVDVIQ